MHRAWLLLLLLGLSRAVQAQDAVLAEVSLRRQGDRMWLRVVGSRPLQCRARLLGGRIRLDIARAVLTGLDLPPGVRAERPDPHAIRLTMEEPPGLDLRLVPTPRGTALALGPRPPGKSRPPGLRISCFLSDNQLADTERGVTNSQLVLFLTGTILK